MDTTDSSIWCQEIHSFSIFKLEWKNVQFYLVYHFLTMQMEDEETNAAINESPAPNISTNPLKWNKSLESIDFTELFSPFQLLYFLS